MFDCITKSSIYSSCRYCFVQLKPEADVEKVKEEISQISFGTGTISVENKITRHEVAEVRHKQRIFKSIFRWI